MDSWPAPSALCLSPAKNKGPWLAIIASRSGFRMVPPRRHGEGLRGGFLVASDRPSPLPNERVEHPRRLETDPLVKGNRPVIRLGYGERDKTESAAPQIPG
jgi:hypothetical protein